MGSLRQACLRPPLTHAAPSNTPSSFRPLGAAVYVSLHIKLFLLVSILFAASESISRNKNFTNPINYAHFIFITRLHRPCRRDNSLMIQLVSWETTPHNPSSCCIKSRIVNAGSDSAMMDVTMREISGQISLRLKRRGGSITIFSLEISSLLSPPPPSLPSTLKASHSFLMVRL